MAPCPFGFVIGSPGIRHGYPVGVPVVGVVLDEVDGVVEVVDPGH